MSILSIIKDFKAQMQSAKQATTATPTVPRAHKITTEPISIPHTCVQITLQTDLYAQE